MNQAALVEGMLFVLSSGDTLASPSGAFILSSGGTLAPPF